MPRGGANPNWEYQLIDQSGHRLDSGLRQGYLLAGKRITRTANNLKKKAKKRQAKALQIDLMALFQTGGSQK